MRQLKNIFGKFWFIFVAAGMLLVFFIVAGKRDVLDVYTGNGSKYTVEKEPETNKTYETQSYVNPKISLSMNVPKDWTYIVKDGFDTFVHPISGTSIQIQVLDYYPMINNISSDSITESYNQRGINVIEINPLSTSSYYVMGQSNGYDGITDYIEYVLWDRQHVVKLLATVADSDYEKMKDEIIGTLDGANWAKEDPIPEGTYLMYSEYGDFEFALPDGWTFANADGAVYASLEEYGCAATVEVLEDTTTMVAFSQIDYTNYVSAGRENFVLTQFQQDETSIYAEATYVLNQTQMSLMQYYLSNGVYHYILTYTCPLEVAETIVPLARNALAVTRIFYEPDPEQLQAIQEASTEKMTEINGFNGALKNEIQQMGENLINNMNNSDENTNTQNDTSQAASLADALVTVAGLNQDVAASVASTWEGLNLGMPTYAEGIKENDQIIVIMISDDNGMKYYLYVNKEQGLEEIHMNTEDGPSINF